MKMLIFSTCYISSEESVIRWLHWFNYYTHFFPDADIFSFYDGPIPDFLDNFKYRDKLISSGKHLGRPITKTMWSFPGWKQSFREALKFARSYNKVIHIESDLYIRNKYISKYSDYFLHLNKYYAGYCNLHKLTETALQVLNNKDINEKIINFYSDEIHLHENKNAEEQLLSIAKPEYIFKGERLEKNIDSLLKNDSMEYFAQCSFDTFKKYL